MYTSIFKIIHKKNRDYGNSYNIFWCFSKNVR